MQPVAPCATGNVVGKNIIFYDGTCGLCHRFVKWALAHDAEGKFLLSPLQGETLKQMVSEDERAKLPDSVVVLTSDGKLLTKSAAAQYVAEQLGLRGRASFIGLFPRWLADFGYDVIAKSRYTLFGRNRGDMCPLVPAELRDRFLP
jgi:predicted DCC family thiol-disulfide oxidoreductase YuxK